MTSNNINKILRSNITLKPWILSKNTNEIVNTCIQKIYKQSQNNYKNVLEAKLATSRPENKGPLRALKCQEAVRIPPSINVTARPKKGAITATNVNAVVNGNADTGIAAATAAAAAGATNAAVAAGGSAAMAARATLAGNRRGAVANLVAHRKLLKSSPNYKIYSSRRRFGSSASSSSASIFRRNDERRRSNTQTAQLKHLIRSFATHMTHARNKPGAAADMSSILPRFMVPARNQHIESRNINEMPPHALQLAADIQRDLLPINSALKDRIALGRPRLSKLDAAQKAKNQDPLSGWHHPASREAFALRNTTADQQGIASGELLQQYQRMKNVNRMRQFEHIIQMEKRRSLWGGMGKKEKLGGVIDQFENVALCSPRTRTSVRNQTPNFERAYKALLLQKDKEVLLDCGNGATVTQSAVNISHITAAAPSAPSLPAAPKSAESASQSPILPSAPTKQHIRKTIKGCSVETPASVGNQTQTPTTASKAISTALATPTNSPLKTAPLSAPKQSAAEPSVPAEILTITKRSPTSQILGRTNVASQNQMRFNHSEHLKRFRRNYMKTN